MPGAHTPPKFLRMGPTSLEDNFTPRCGHRHGGNMWKGKNLGGKTGQRIVHIKPYKTI